MNQNIDNQLFKTPIPLPMELKKCGFLLSQEYRGFATAAYSVTDTITGSEHGFEVFEIKVQQPKTLPNGVQMPLKEKYPSPEDFGKWAKAPGNFKRAIEIFLEMELKELSKFCDFVEPVDQMVKNMMNTEFGASL